jgi:hypothetical protein
MARRTDRRRLSYVARLLVANGAEPRAAATRARLLYLALIGSFFAGPSPELALSPALWRDFADIALGQASRAPGRPLTRGPGPR